MRFNNLKEEEVLMMTAYNFLIDYRYLTQERDVQKDKQAQIRRIEDEKAKAKRNKGKKR